MKTLSTSYRLTFTGGPQDGQFFSTKRPPEKFVSVPARPCERPLTPGESQSAYPIAVYELAGSECDFGNDLSHVVLHYHFRVVEAKADSQAAPQSVTTHIARAIPRWLTRGAAALQGWMLKPVGYPMNTRDSNG